MNKIVEEIRNEIKGISADDAVVILKENGFIEINDSLPDSFFIKFMDLQSDILSKPEMAGWFKEQVKIQIRMSTQKKYNKNKYCYVKRLDNDYLIVEDGRFLILSQKERAKEFKHRMS